VLLLVAIIGAVVVSKREKSETATGKNNDNRKNLDKATG